ncbi:MAG TPA: type IV secretion system DNA-binding domain-containing protein [Nevskiaceae bacterium]|nr:type IV secretion system DNA-binding domain-containing protein [Nevskiaceae bacterium]
MDKTEKAILEIKIPRENEYTPESAAALFAGFTETLSSRSFLDRIRCRQPEPLILEIACFKQEIHFYVVLSQAMLPFFESQTLAAYPLAVLTPSPNYLADWDKKNLGVGQMVQSSSYYYPIKTYKDFTDVDPLSAILAVLSKTSENDKLLIQFVLQKASSGWQTRARKAVERGIKISEEERQPLPGEELIKQKIGESGLKTAIRIAASSKNLINALAGSFASFTRGDGNSLVFHKPNRLIKEKFKRAILNRQAVFTPRFQILAVSELASLWHLPGVNTKIPSIAWGRSVLTEAPENLPASINLADEQKQEINFFARTEFKNKLVTFGIKQKDRRRHIYLVGKTGTGKSTLIANMVIDDLKKKKGLAVIDPHGDLSEILLDYIPSYRINDVVYLDPADKDHPFSINVLEVKDPAQAELIASGIVSIFYKLYSYSWGPRLEHILRNTLLTLAQIPNSTLVDVIQILTNKNFRRKALEKLDDPTTKRFWLEEFEKMPDRLQQEAISPILNKVGQFVTSPLIRGLIGRPKSTIDLEKIMNQGKILIVNLSQGRLGEDNSALLGAMVITKIQLAAMSRVNIPEEERRDFYLYVDEFQNFATDSFIKILSEARKYRLSLCLANQYMAQIDEPVQKAILGNTGTLVSFLVGAEDAQILEKEFGGIYTANDLVGLSNFQTITKLAIDNLTSRPFFAYTLPLPKSVNQNRPKVIRISRERYSYKKDSLR